MPRFRLAPPLSESAPLDPVRALQHTLYRAAKADPGRRFHALMDKVYPQRRPVRAWFNVRRNDGAPGVDQDHPVGCRGVRGHPLLGELAGGFEGRRYRPLPARRVFIPKPGHGGAAPLSIPSVRDRIVQAAVKIVLEPVFEADLLPCSFGFRPKRSAHDALQVSSMRLGGAPVGGGDGYRQLFRGDPERQVDASGRGARLRPVRAQAPARDPARRRDGGRAGPSAGDRDPQGGVIVPAVQRLPAPARPGVGGASTGCWSVSPTTCW